MMKDLPPEIFSRVLEIGVCHWGIRYLPPVCLTCRDWNDMVECNPRLWGFVTIPEFLDDSTRELLDLQIARAKNAPLTVFIHPDANLLKSNLRSTTDKVVSLAQNWVSADVSTILFQRADLKRSDLSNLDSLRLCHKSSVNLYNSETFFDRDSCASLRSLAVQKVPLEWISGFLSCFITSFHLSHQSWNLKCTIQLLQQVPSLVSLQLSCHSHPHPSFNAHDVLLESLTHLELYNVQDAALLLFFIRAPALHTLSIKSCWHTQWVDASPMRVFFTQWSLSDVMPRYLHTLEIQESLFSGDMGFLINWLHRLRSLNRLILSELELDLNSDIVTALTSSEPLLCPSLLQLFIETKGLELDDLFRIALARGRTSGGQLRLLESLLCSNGSFGEIEQLSSLVDALLCGCLRCQLER